MKFTENLIFDRHRGPVTCVAGIAGSRWVTSAAYDGAVALFHLDTHEVKLLGYHEHLVNKIAVNQSGTKAASSSSDYNIYIWDLTTEKLDKVLIGHNDDVEDFVFIDEQIGASVSRDWRVILWDLNKGNIKKIIGRHEMDALSVAYHKGKLYTSGDDMTMRVWDVETGQQTHQWGPFETETDTCAIDALNGRAILGCDDGFVRVFDMETGATLTEFLAHGSAIKKVAVSPINGDILSAAYDQNIHIWEAKSWKKKLSLVQHSSKWERSFNWTPDGKGIVAETFDGTVLHWDSENGALIAEIGNKEGNACFNDVSATSNGEIATVSDDGYIRLAKLTSNGKEWVQKIEPKSGRMLMNGVIYDEKSSLIVGGSHNQKLHIFNKENGAINSSSETFLGEGPINCVRVAHQTGYEGVTFVACYSGAIVKVDKSGTIVGKFFPHENAVKALRLHPSKTIGVSCSADGILVSWDFEGNILKEYLGHMAIIDDVDISPSGKLIASTGRDFTVKIYDLERGEMLNSVLSTSH